MADFQNIYNGRVDNDGAAAKGRGLTPACWLGVDTTGMDPTSGMFYFNDFYEYSTALYTATQATTGTVAHVLTAENGIIELDSASGTNGQGINVQFQGPIITPASGQVICFETRVQPVDIATGPEFFAGLAVTDGTIINTNAIAVADWVGLYSLDGTNLYAGLEDGAQSVSSSSVGSFTDGSWIKLGFRWVVDHSFQVFVDGEEVNQDVDATVGPDTFLRPSFVCQSNGNSVDPIVNVDYFAVGRSL